MSYIENPKTKGSGIICCIPQPTPCPSKCDDCFFQSGRSYLAPIEDNIPNMPTIEEVGDRVVRVNDGHDSNHNRTLVMSRVAGAGKYKRKFYNTSIPNALREFDAPVVLTVNPSHMTNADFYRLSSIPLNLMYVRARTNMWNVRTVVNDIIKYYTGRSVVVVLTFMAYHLNRSIPNDFKDFYEFRKRTLNRYWAIKHNAWLEVMYTYHDNPFVYSCGIEGISSLCKRCGNCLREYFATIERMKIGERGI